MQSLKLRRCAIVYLWLIVSVSGVLGFGAYRSSSSPAPKYDLLFSIDYREKSYSDPDSTGVVIRVIKRQPTVIFTGNWGKPSFVDLPSLYVCQAASGKIREIPLELLKQPSLKNENGTDSVIEVQPLASLVVDNSSIAPDGYSLSGLNFTKTYGILDIVMPSLFSPFPDGQQLKQDSYKVCLRQVAGRQSGLTIHFIGWIVPKPATVNTPSVNQLNLRLSFDLNRARERSSHYPSPKVRGGCG